MPVLVCQNLLTISQEVTTSCPRQEDFFSKTGDKSHLKDLVTLSRDLEVAIGKDTKVG